MKDLKSSQSKIKSLGFFVRRSSAVHVAIVLLALVGSKIAINRAEDLKNSNLELIQASVRVDMVAMPTHTITELKNISSGRPDAAPEVKSDTKEEIKEEVKEETKEEVKEEVKAEAKEESGIDPVVAFEEAAAAKKAKEQKEAEQKRKDFLNKLQKISKKEVAQPKKPAKEKAKESGLGGAAESALKNLVLSGNKLSKGTAITGDGSGAALTAFQEYASRIPDFVRPHWTLPSYLLDKELQCRIRVWLNNSGEVVRTSVYQSSGDTEYDQRAISAVKSASPFPELKQEYGQRAQNGDILLGFPL